MTLWELNRASVSECKSQENNKQECINKVLLYGKFLGCSEACQYYENSEMSCQHYSFKGTVFKNREECNRLVKCMKFTC